MVLFVVFKLDAPFQKFAQNFKVDGAKVTLKINADTED